MISKELLDILSEINPLSDLPALVARAGQLLDTAALLGLSMDLWQIQNRLLDLQGVPGRWGPTDRNPLDGPAWAAAVRAYQTSPVTLSGRSTRSVLRSWAWPHQRQCQRS